MKAAKIRFRFDDGTTADVDLALAYGKAHSQLARYLRRTSRDQCEWLDDGDDGDLIGKPQYGPASFRVRR